MGRYKPGHRDATRKKIVAAAAEMLRREGFSDTSVMTVMQAAGLTHGGFYAHFPDKEALLAAALEEAFATSPGNFDFMTQRADAQGDPGAIAEMYLSDQRIEDVAHSCPAAALGSEMHRQPEALRRLFAAQSAETARVLARDDRFGPHAEAPEAWAPLALLAGALMLARAVPDPALRAVIRDQVAVALRRLATPPSPPEPSRAKRMHDAQG